MRRNPDQRFLILLISLDMKLFRDIKIIIHKFTLEIRIIMFNTISKFNLI